MSSIQNIDEEVIQLVEALPFLLGTDVELFEENAQRLLARIADGPSKRGFDPRKTSARSFLSGL